MELLAEARRESEQIAAGAEQLAETRCRLVGRARTAAYAEPLAETNWSLAEWARTAADAQPLSEPRGGSPSRGGSTYCKGC